MPSKSFLEDVEIIHNDTQSGAAKIAENSLRAFKRECIQLGSKLDKTVLKTAIKLLLDTHPMASIENALLPVYARMIQLINIRGIRNLDLKTTIESIFTSHRDKMRIGEKKTLGTLIKVLQDRKSILTFSNSSTINTALLQLARDGYRDKKIFILESRPLKEGEQTALSMTKAGFKEIHFGIDFAINEFSQNAEIAVLGADMIHPNGQVLNKIGSATIAYLFHMRSKELIVAASPTKICLRGIINHDHVWHPVIPHRNPKEITTTSNPNLIIWNKYFEIIQPEYISSLIMDRHQFSSPISIRLKKFLEQDVAISSYIKAFRELRHNADFATI